MERDVYSKLPRYWTQFENGSLSEDEQANTSGKIALLKRSIYGLKDGAHLYYIHFRQSMKKMGYKQSKIDNCLWYKGSLSTKDFICIMTHVDDCTVLASSQSLLDEFNTKISEVYVGTFDLDLKFIIGIAINERENGDITIDQNKYTRDLLKRHNYEATTGEPHATHNTPLPTTAKFTSKLEDGERQLHGEEVTLYQSVVGGLLYLHARVDLGYAVGKLCRYMHAPTSRHMGFAKHVLKYLRNTSRLGIRYQASGDNIIRASCDASYLDSPDDGKSTLGFIITLNGGTIAFKSKLSKIVCTSTCYSEYVAIYEVTRMVIMLRRLTAEMGAPQPGATPILCDNAAAIEVATAMVEPSSHRHIMMRYHFIRECWNDVNVKFITTKEQTSDILAKSLPRETFEKFRDGLQCDVEEYADNHENMMTVPDTTNSGKGFG